MQTASTHTERRTTRSGRPRWPALVLALALLAFSRTVARSSTPADRLAHTLDAAACRRLLGEARAAMQAFAGGPPGTTPSTRRGRPSQSVPVTREGVAPLRKVRAGAFVTLELHGRVRGCRGTLEPTTASLLDEVRRNAVAAATHDVRFPPLTRNELDHARISITVVTDLQPLPSVRALSRAEGLVVRCGDRVGVVLPYEGSDPETRLRWGYQKAGVTPDDACDLYCMSAIRFAEETRP